MREEVVQKLYKNGCTNIISLSNIPTIFLSPLHLRTYDRIRQYKGLRSIYVESYFQVVVGLLNNGCPSFHSCQALSLVSSVLTRKCLVVLCHGMSSCVSHSFPCGF